MKQLYCTQPLFGGNFELNRNFIFQSTLRELLTVSVNLPLYAVNSIILRFSFQILYSGMSVGFRLTLLNCLFHR